LAALQRPGPAGAAEEGPAASPPDPVGDELEALAGLEAVDWAAVADADADGEAVAALWLVPQPLSSSTAAAAAVTEVMTGLCFIC
jgi:hypothetical protein